MRRGRTFTRILLLMVWGWLIAPAVGAADNGSSSGTSSAGVSTANPGTAGNTGAGAGAGIDNRGDESRLPVARSVANLSTVAGIAVAIDGSASHDPRGQRITF